MPKIHPYREVSLPDDHQAFDRVLRAHVDRALGHDLTEGLEHSYTTRETEMVIVASLDIQHRVGMSPRAGHVAGNTHEHYRVNVHMPSLQSLVPFEALSLLAMVDVAALAPIQCAFRTPTWWFGPNISPLIPWSCDKGGEGERGGVIKCKFKIFWPFQEISVCTIKHVFKILYSSTPPPTIIEYNERKGHGTSM